MKIFESDSYYLIFLFLGISVFLYIVLSRLNKSNRNKSSAINFNHYSLKESVLTKNELAFYETLKEVVNDKVTILSMVRLADIFSVQKGKGNQAALNRIISRHVDFLLCQKDTLCPIVAIELDDKSHERSERIKRDDFVNKLFESAGLPILRYQSKYRYSPNDLIRKLEPLLMTIDDI